MMLTRWIIQPSGCLAKIDQIYIYIFKHILTTIITSKWSEVILVDKNIFETQMIVDKTTVMSKLEYIQKLKA